MKTMSTLTMSSAMAALLVFAAPAHAQQQDITEEEVRSYLEQLQQEATEIVRGKEFQRIDEVTDRHIAEGAVFAVTGEMMKNDRRKTFMAATLEREDVMALKHKAVGMMQSIDIEDYTLDVEVSEVRAHGPGAATVKATWTDSGAVSVAAPVAAGQMETGQLQPGQPQATAPETTAPGTAPQTARQTAQEQTEQQPEAGKLTFERTFECHHVVQREGEDLKIGLTTCQAEVRL